MQSGKVVVMTMDSLKNFAIDRLPLVYVFLSGIGFSIQTLIIKLLSEQGFRGSFYCVFSRGALQLVLSIIFLVVNHINKKPDEVAPQLFGDTNYVRSMMVLRSIVGYFSIAFSFLSAEYIPIGDSTVLVMLSPIVAALASFVILGEPWLYPELIATVLSVTGAVLVAKPPFIFGYDDTMDVSDTKQFYIGVACSLFAAVCAGFAFVLIRVLGTSAKMPWANVCFIQALGQLMLSVPSLYISGQKLDTNISAYELFLIFLGGFIGAWSQVAMTVGMQREKSAAASAMRMSDVVFGFIWQVLFTSDALSMLSLSGAILVTSSILVIVFFKQNNTAPAGTTSQGAPVLPGATATINPMRPHHQYEMVASLEVDEDEESTRRVSASGMDTSTKVLHRGDSWIQDVLRSSQLGLKQLLGRQPSSPAFELTTVRNPTQKNSHSSREFEPSDDDTVEISLQD